MNHDRSNFEHAGQLHHIELCASDLGASVDFWTWLLTELGYEQNNEWDGGRSWSNDPTYIVIKQADISDDPFDRQAPGLNHLAFHADSRDQVDELTAGIRERADSVVLYEDQHPYAGGSTHSTAKIQRGSKWRSSVQNNEMFVRIRVSVQRQSVATAADRNE